MVQELSTAGVQTVVAGNYGVQSSSWLGEGQSATNPYYAMFNQITGVAVDSVGNLYISDVGFSKIFKVTASTGIITTVAGNGSSSSTGDGGPATAASIGIPFAVAVDSAGNIYIADRGNNRIRKVTASTGIITTVAGAGPTGPYNGSFSGDGGLAISATLNTPVGVTVDISGNVYIADAGNNRIREVAASTGIIVTVAGSGGTGYNNCAYSGDSGLATNARLCSPWGIAVDKVGDLFIGDSGNSVVREVISSTGVITTVAGNGTQGYSGWNGPATDAEFSVMSVSLDNAGNLYIFDMANDLIWVVGQLPPQMAVLDPLYQVTSIVYAAPGNKSSAGYTSTATNGSTATMGNSFANATSVNFTEGFMPFGVGVSLSESFSIGQASSSSHAFQETFTDATSVANQSNTNNPNTVNHGNDEILIWLNPEISFSLSGSLPATYSVATQTTINGQAQPPDIIGVAASTMEDNGSGQTTVDPGYLNPQTIPSGTNGTQVTLPGLAAICKNVNMQEYLNGACTKGDQCGCQPSDFSGILVQDPLLNYNGTGLPYSGTVSPLEADVSGASICLSPSSSTDCRYIAVPLTKGSSQIAFETLQGPQCPSCNNYPNTFTQTDATANTQTLGGQTSQSVGAGFKTGFGTFSLSVMDTFTWGQTQSTGTTTGSGNSQTVTLNSSTVGCIEDVSIYEDTVYHTFVFQEPTGNGTCP